MATRALSKAYIDIPFSNPYSPLDLLLKALNLLSQVVAAQTYYNLSDTKAIGEQSLLDGCLTHFCAEISLRRVKLSDVR